MAVKLSASTYFSQGGRKESSGDQAKDLILIESIDLVWVPWKTAIASREVEGAEETGCWS